jgi:hypothetical protein
MWDRTELSLEGYLEQNARSHKQRGFNASTILAFDVFDFLDFVGLSAGSYIYQLSFLQTIRNHYVALLAPISPYEKHI